MSGRLLVLLLALGELDDDLVTRIGLRHGGQELNLLGAALLQHPWQLLALKVVLVPLLAALVLCKTRGRRRLWALRALTALVVYVFLTVSFNLAGM